MRLASGEIEPALARLFLGDAEAEREATDAASDSDEPASRVIGARVRRLRWDYGLSQRGLAERIGSTQPAIARLEAGRSAPSLGTLEKIAEALDRVLVVDFHPRQE